ncbi:SRPBCC family protein [Actinomycetospora sp. NBRC 106378]|uniref:SRPBCC family protein n=1 Tax=Actinomycetospora sp. NBRC 106378 TaxID=3032208 RepID=UPI0024A1FB16|nr:SRPBCC family protein [Actinomycetospora sp. NBRC 106378]GLZ53508.1 hypothetical protein Acsp07_31250 [Actinomycetospora sp. NBRC 106378]
MTGTDGTDGTRAGDPVRRITHTLTLARDPDQVWAALTDVDRMPGLHPNMLSARWVDGAHEAELGARFVSDHAHAEHGVWHAVSRIVALEREKTIAWTVDSDLAPPTVCRFDLCPDLIDDRGATPRTVLRQTWFHETRPGFSAPIAEAVADQHGCQRTT